MPAGLGKVKPRFKHCEARRLFSCIVHFVFVVQSRFANRVSRVCFLNGAHHAIEFLRNFFSMRDEQYHNRCSQKEKQQTAHQIKKLAPQPRPPPRATFAHAAIGKLPPTLRLGFRQQRACVHCHLHKSIVTNCMPASIAA